VTARIGPGDISLYESPHPRLLRMITGRDPEAQGTHVLLKPFGIRSTQRLLVSDVGGSALVAFWPAELKPQAEYLYRDGRGVALVRAALKRGWRTRLDLTRSSALARPAGDRWRAGSQDDLSLQPSACPEPRFAQRASAARGS
jgi:hypothetical protein